MNAEESKEVFIHNVRQRREAEGISISELARRSGVPLTMLEELERGVLPKRMMVDDAWRLSKVFGCELHELFRQVPEPSK